MTSALRVVRSIGALPATVVTPSSSVWRAATTSAIASSWPGSQSTMTGTAIRGAPPVRGQTCSAPSASRVTERPTHSPSQSAAAASAALVIPHARRPSARRHAAMPVSGRPSRSCMTV